MAPPGIQLDDLICIWNFGFKHGENRITLMYSHLCVDANEKNLSLEIVRSSELTL